MDLQSLSELRARSLKPKSIPKKVIWRHRLNSVWTGEEEDLDVLISAISEKNINMNKWLETNVKILEKVMNKYNETYNVAKNIEAYVKRIRHSLKAAGVSEKEGSVNYNVQCIYSLIYYSEVSFPKRCVLEQALYYIFLFQSCLDSTTAPLFKYDFSFVPEDL